MANDSHQGRPMRKFMEIWRNLLWRSRRAENWLKTRCRNLFLDVDLTFGEEQLISWWCLLWREFESCLHCTSLLMLQPDPAFLMHDQSILGSYMKLWIFQTTSISRLLQTNVSFLHPNFVAFQGRRVVSRWCMILPPCWYKVAAVCRQLLLGMPWEVVPARNRFLGTQHNLKILDMFLLLYICV